ncbi:hypothetical protein D0C36_08085 [Mucilaginibacter conchicola]|uniref:Uncharacterized protein n=1 Tax=Mucilaginibacter conchicola TaxID=2303333 RepID=A0A372NZC3_9SPHI|nr:hypothetical protein [Mucilaginibacter conchicola]RFZ95470.1 hypothetical protein D0C36_08085 [Mucilaginibacter conchicola]
MSYDIRLHTIQTRNLEESSDNEDFFDGDDNLHPFTDKQFNSLKKSMAGYGYEIVTEQPQQIEYRHPDYNITALLTQHALYFNSGFDQDSIFEAGMAASELTDTGEFAKYDPQADGWEDV